MKRPRPSAEVETRREEPANIDRVGVTRTQLAVESTLGWIFREQPVEDFGIDALVEVVDNKKVTGLLLGVQIKSGESWFRKPAAGGWWYYPRSNKAHYWTNHSLPVVLVLYDPKTERCYWELVNDTTLIATSGEGKKLLVPEAHVLDETARIPLQNAARRNPGVPRTHAHPTHFGTGRFPPSRRLVVAGTVTTAAALAAPTMRLLSSNIRFGATPTSAPIIVSADKVLLNPGKVEAVRFDPRGRTLAGSRADGTIQLWETATWTESHVFHASAAGWVIAYSRDGRYLASGDAESPAISLLDVAAKRVIPLSGQVKRITSVAFNPNGKTLVSASDWDTIGTWDVARRRHISYSSVNVSVASMAFNRDGNVLALGCNDHTVRLWNLYANASFSTLRGHAAQVESVAFSPDWTTLASGSNDHTVRLWNPATGDGEAVLRGHTAEVESVAFSPDGKTLASAGDDNTIRLWDLANRQMIATLRGHADWVVSVAFSPDGKTLASGSYDTTIRLWKISR